MRSLQQILQAVPFPVKFSIRYFGIPLRHSLFLLQCRKRICSCLDYQKYQKSFYRSLYQQSKIGNRISRMERTIGTTRNLAKKRDARKTSRRSFLRATKKWNLTKALNKTICPSPQRSQQRNFYCKAEKLMVPFRVPLNIVSFEVEYYFILLLQ